MHRLFHEMEHRISPYGIFDISDASQMNIAHMMHFQSGSATVNPSTPPPLPSPLLLLHSPPYDSSLDPIMSPLPPSYNGSRLPSQLCAQERRCATTDSIDVRIGSIRNGMIHDRIRIDRDYEEVELDLSLGPGGYHQEPHGVLPQIAASEAAEHSASSITELDRSNNGVAAADFSPLASLPLAFKSCEGTSWESTSASSSDHRLASVQSHQNVGDSDELCPTLAMAGQHSVSQAREDGSRAFSFAKGALPADRAFPFAMETFPADRVFVASQEEKVFFCKFCDRRFHSSQALGGHQNAHKRERLVVRSSSMRTLGPPAVFSCAVLGSTPFQLPSACSMHHGANHEDGPSAAHPLIASMCRDKAAIASLPCLQAFSMCKDRFEAPPLFSSMSNSGIVVDCLPSSSVYMENRSLSIKAHSLVHKPSSVHSFAPRMGHLKANMNAISSADRASAAAYHNRSRGSVDAQPRVARCFAISQDHHVHHQYRQCMPSHESYVLHRPLANLSANSLQPGMIKSGFTYDLDSSSTIVDLALHL